MATLGDKRSAIEEARTRLVAAMTALLPDLPPWRFHRYPPPQVVNPCVWVDFPYISSTQPVWTVATFPIVISLDGTDHAQAQAFDFAVAAIWDAINSVDDATATSAAPWARDIGGPASRLYVINADVDLSADVLCFAPLHTESATT